MSRPTDSRPSPIALFGQPDDAQPFVADASAQQPSSLYLDRDKHQIADPENSGQPGSGPRKSQAVRNTMQLSRTNTSLREPRTHPAKNRGSRYDERSTGLFDDPESISDRSGPWVDQPSSALTPIVLAKKAYRLVVFLVVWAIAIGLRYVANQVMDAGLLHTVAGDTHQVSLNMSSCFVYLASSAPGSGLSIQYTGHRQVFSPDILFAPKRVTLTQSRVGTLSTVSVFHDYNDYTCQLNVSVPIGVRLQRLAVNCSQCTVIARNTFAVDSLELTGNAVYTNFADLQAGQITTDVKAGTLQFNELSLERDSRFVATNGTVIVQMRQNFAVSLESATNMFCMSGPHVDNKAAVSCTLVQVTDQLTQHIYNITNYTQCTGVVSVCKTTGCSPTVKLSFQSLTGSIYANQLSTLGSKMVDNTSEVFTGSAFNDGIKLSSADSKILYRTFQEANNPNSLPLILKIDVGNYKGESSSNSKWMISQYPLSSVYSPWMIAGSTFGMYTSNFKEFNINLSYRPSLNQRNHAAIKSLLTTVSNQVFNDSVYAGLVLETDDPILSTSSSTTYPDASGFYTSSYTNEPIITDLATIFGSNIEEALVSSANRIYNNPNISTWICK
jgi:hypothetical protein